LTSLRRSRSAGSGRGHRDENNSRPPNCGDDHRWGPGDGYSSQNPDDGGLCRSKGQGGGHEGDTKGGGTAGGGGGMGHY